jgi:hypothetical protein
MKKLVFASFIFTIFLCSTNSYGIGRSRNSFATHKVILEKKGKVFVNKNKSTAALHTGVGDMEETKDIIERRIKTISTVVNFFYRSKP